jgi:hypothetical protein
MDFVKQVLMLFCFVLLAAALVSVLAPPFVNSTPANGQDYG